MSLLKRVLDRFGVEERDYGGGVFTDPYNYGLPASAIPTNGMLAGAGIGNSYVSPDTAMHHWAVFACVRLIADTIASLPIDEFGADEQPIEPVDKRLVTPSAYATRAEWIWQVMASLLLTGNAYGLISAVDRLGYPVQIDLLNPQGIVVEKDKEGRKILRVQNKILLPGEFWHLPGPQFPGELAGLSPIKYAARTISLGLEAESFGSEFFTNGINPSAVLETQQQINDDQAAAVKQRVKQSMGNNDIVVLGAGMTLNPWQMSAQDAQFIETQTHNAVAVAQIFGVPPEFLGTGKTGGTITYANREQRAQDYLQNAINPWLTRLEDSLTAWFPRGTYVKFNTGALLRSDLLTRYESYQLGIHNNFLLPSEARALEDLPDIPGIDEKPLPGAPVSGGGSPQGSSGSDTQQ